MQMRAASNTALFVFAIIQLLLLFICDDLLNGSYRDFQDLQDSTESLVFQETQDSRDPQAIPHTPG